MLKHAVHSLIVCELVLGIVCGQQPSPTTSSELQPAFTDQFVTDSREDYEFSGAVQWNPGHLTVNSGTTLARELGSGPRARINLAINRIMLPDDKLPAEFRIWWLLNGAPNCFVRIQVDAVTDGLCTGVLSIVHVADEEGTLTEQLVRNTPFVDVRLEQLTVEYRYGLVSVTVTEQPLLAGQIYNQQAEVARCRIESVAGGFLLENFAALRTEPVPEPTTEQELQLAKANALNSELLSLFRQSRFAEAAAAGEQALKLRISVLGEDSPACANMLNNVATMYVGMGDFARAEPLLQQASRILRVTVGNHHMDYASSLNDLGSLYSEGDSARAEPLYQESLQIRRLVLGEQDSDYSVGLNNLATLYVSLGDYARAEPLYLESLECRRAASGETTPEYAGTLSNLALMYVNMGDYERAEPLYQQAEDIFRNVLGETHPSYATSLNNRAWLYLNMRDFDQAEPLYRRCSEIFRTVLGDQHPSYAQTLNNLARLYESRGDYAEAEPILQQALQIKRDVLGEQHPSYALSLNNLAGLYVDQGDFVRADALYAEALHIQRRNLDQNSIIQSERQQTRNQTKERIFLDSRLTNALQLQTGADEVLEDLWQWKGAVTSRQQAYRRVAANPQLAPLFAKLQSVSGDLSAISGRMPIPPPASAPEAQHTAWQQRRKLWEDQFAKLSSEHESLERQIAADSREFQRIREPLTVQDIQRALPSDTACIDLIEYNHRLQDPEQQGHVIYERRYLAFVIRPDTHPVMVPAGPAAALADAITSFRVPLVAAGATAAQQNAAADAAQQIRDQLWVPIEQHLQGIRTVIIAPDTALGMLPFGALPGTAANRYLLEDYRIAMLPMLNQLSTVFEDDGSNSSHTGLLLVGDVDYNAARDQPDSTRHNAHLLADASGLRGGRPRQWASLSGFREELLAVESAYRGRFGDDARTFRLSGPAADEPAFLTQAPQFGTVHVITHGYFEDPNIKSIDQADVSQDALSNRKGGPDPFINAWLPGLLSGLVLAGANQPADGVDDPRDGILRATEIEASSMQDVDLVVLSACETGLGAVAGGEGLTGLQRAFHVAGARTVVASMWKVDDTATLELMRRFYTNLWEHDMRKLDALREAQLWMLRHPNELDAMGVTGAATRGEIREVKPNAERPRGLPKAVRTDPFYWAAFQLSGDWR